MLLLNCGEFEVLVTNQSSYQHDSADNLRRFDRVTGLSHDDGHWSSQHAVVILLNDEEIGSHILAAAGGGTGISKNSALIHENELILAVGNSVCALQIPSLDVIWQAQVDLATCFGVHLPPHRDCLISHGELEISRVTFDGKFEWQSSGADIFIGNLEVFDDHVEVVDWNGWRYQIDIKTGENTQLSSS